MKNATEVAKEFYASGFSAPIDLVRLIEARDAEWRAIAETVSANANNNMAKDLADEMVAPVLAQLRVAEAKVKHLLDPIVRAKMLEPGPPIYVTDPSGMLAESQARVRELEAALARASGFPQYGRCAACQGVVLLDDDGRCSMCRRLSAPAQPDTTEKPR